MKINRFFAKTMRGALQQVREEQGPDSVILSNRQVTGGIEVIAAVDYDEALLHQTYGRSSFASSAAGSPAAALDAEPADNAPIVVLPEPVASKIGAALHAWVARFVRQGIPSLNVLAYNEIPDNRKVRLVAAVGS